MIWKSELKFYEPGKHQQFGWIYCEIGIEVVSEQIILVVTFFSGNSRHNFQKGDECKTILNLRNLKQISSIN